MLLFLFFNWSRVDLQYFVSGAQQSDSVTHIHISTPFSILSFLIDYYRILSKVPCAIKQVLVGHLFYI